MVTHHKLDGGLRITDAREHHPIDDELGIERDGHLGHTRPPEYPVAVAGSPVLRSVT